MARYEVWLNRAAVDSRLPSVMEVDGEASVIMTDEWVIISREGVAETRYNKDQVVSVTRFEE